MKIALIQSKQNKLYEFENCYNISKTEALCLQQEMLEQNFNLLEDTCKKGCNLIVTSEAINFCRDSKYGIKYEFFHKENNKLFEKFSECAKKSRSYLVAGVYNFRKNNLYNSAFIYSPKGDLIDIYDKIHLAGNEKEILKSGDRYVVFETEFGKIGVCICWDMQFPETCRELVLRGADLIVCPTWGWEKIYAHTRAYENGVFVAGAMAVPYKGIIDGIRTPSEVVSPDGKILAMACNNDMQVLTCDINLDFCFDFKKLRLNDRRSDTYLLISK
jgi:predicted amidohydrolase